MTASLVLGVDIGTSSSKGVLVDLEGRIRATTVREHEVSRPHVGWAEMDGMLWWSEFVSIAEELVSRNLGAVIAVGVSGMGPCVLVADVDGVPLRPAKIPVRRSPRRQLRAVPLNRCSFRS